MPWFASIHPSLPIVVTQYVGVLTPSELSDAVQETLNLAYMHGTPLLLGDCTALEGGHSIADLYALARNLMEVSTTLLLKEAVLLPTLPAAAQDVKFWEDTSVNHGLQVQIFQDRQSALDWLLQEETP